MYQNILQEEVRVAVHQLKLSRSWMKQQNIDKTFKQIHLIMASGKEKKKHLLEWSS